MTSSWINIGYHTSFWSSAAHDASWSRRRRLRNKGNYSQAVLYPIAELSPHLSSQIFETVQVITEDLTRFDAQYDGGAPFTAVLLRSESAASSQIEQLTANARRIALATLGDTSRQNARLIASNTLALEAAIRLANELTVDSMLEMHRVLLQEEQPEHAGQLRQETVWIGGDSPVTAMFVPPAYQDVPAAMQDLVEFMRRTDLNAFVQAAIAHAQFETIHPFTDGNGRTGRALVSALLRARGTTRNFTVPLSSGLLTDTGQYFAALNAYRQGDAEPIIQQFVTAAHSAMSNAQVLLEDLDTVRQQVLDSAARVTKNLRSIAELCVTEPAFTAGMVTALGIPSTTAYTALGRLVDKGLLRSESKISGQSVWSVIGLTQALDAFAHRAGRRSFDEPHRS